MSNHPTDRETSGAGGYVDLSSLALLRRARRGDDEALNRLYQRYLPLLQRWAKGRLPRWARDIVDTDDLVQETLTRTFNQVRHFEPRRDRGLHLYLREALRNRIRDELRRARRGPGELSKLDEQASASETSPLDQAIADETLARYEAALAALPEADRAIIVARVDFGMTYREIAEISGKPTEDAARMAVSRSLVKIADALGADD